MTKSTKQSKPSNQPAAYDSKVLTISKGKDEAEMRRNIAESIANPNIAAGRLLRAFNKDCVDIGLDAAVSVMREQAELVRAGDMSRAEAMLITQAHALNAMFTNLAERAQNQTGLPQIQCLMGLALKSQSQCRATLEALAEMKNPRAVAFVKQANIANGPQQVNNAQSSRAGEIPNSSNELSGSGNGVLEDTRAQSIASRANPEMATVGKVERAEVGERKGEVCP